MPKTDIPRVVFGTYRLKGGVCRKACAAAAAAGFSGVDTASVYGNEADVRPGPQTFCITKLWRSAHADEARIRAEARRSLRRLGRIDLYLVHWPGPAFPLHGQGVPAKQVPSAAQWPPARWGAMLAETWRVMALLRDEGVVGAIGLANVTARQVRDLIAATSVAPALVQVEAHPLLPPEPALLELAQTHGFVVQAHSSLAQCRPVGPCGESLLETEPIAAAVKAMGGKHTAAQILLRWALDQGLHVIASSSRPDRIKAMGPSVLEAMGPLPATVRAILDEHTGLAAPQRVSWAGRGRGDPEFIHLVCQACGVHTGDLTPARLRCARCQKSDAA